MTVNNYLIMRLIVILFSMLTCVEAKYCNFNIQVEQTLTNEGFHRNLTFSINFASDYEEERLLYDDCLVGVEQTLPSGLYATQDEINDNRCENLKKTVFLTPVNIERPADKSEPIVIHLLTEVKDYQAYIYIPVHMRYQEAVAGGGIVRNYIPVPKLYLRCPEKRLDVCDDLYTKTSKVNNFCGDQSKRDCLWKEIPIVMVTAPLTWDIPVGNTEHFTAVSFCTLFVIILGSMYLLKALLENKIPFRRSNGQ